MNKTDNYSARYKIEPCQIVIPCTPLIAESEDFSCSAQIQISGVRSLKTSAKQALILTDRLLKPVRRQLKNGKCQELCKLLETRPEFSAHPWVREEFLKWISTGRSFTKRGRRIGSFEVHPLIVAALVDELIARRSAPNRERAFVWLANNDWLEYETAKKQYYQAIGEDRFRAALIQNSISSTSKPRLKARRLIRSADRLQPRHSVTRTLLESPLGALTVTITAK